MTDMQLTEIIDGLIDHEARELHESLHLGLRPYRNGEENQAAARVITVIPPDQAAAVLGWLVREEIGRTIACLCLLDECDETSYSAEADLSDMLTAAIIRQDRVATRELVTHMICNRAQNLAVAGVPGSATHASCPATARRPSPPMPAMSRPCDVPACPDGVAGSRTITLIPQRQADKPLSVLIRLCAMHTATPYDELLKLLPKLAELAEAAGPTAYLGPEAS
jgi:hypothetical protein